MMKIDFRHISTSMTNPHINSNMTSESCSIFVKFRKVGDNRVTYLAVIFVFNFDTNSQSFYCLKSSDRQYIHQRDRQCHHTTGNTYFKISKG